MPAGSSLRLADGAANPYLMQAAVLSAGLDGVKNAAIRDNGWTSTCTLRATRPKMPRKLPLNLLDALRALEKSSVLKEAFGEAVVSSYLKLKYDDWNAYCRHLTEWERQTTLDC